jgi:hypothetical protein
MAIVSTIPTPNLPETESELNLQSDPEASATPAIVNKLEEKPGPQLEASPRNKIVADAQTPKRIQDPPVNEKTEPETPTATPANIGLLHIGLSKKTRGVWADVFVDGQSKGRTRGGSDPIRLEIAPGAHVLKVTNDYALAFERRFELDAGQSLRFEDIVLRKRPLSIQLKPELAPDCILRLGDETLGSLGSLGFRSTLENPSHLARLHITCPDGKLYGPFDMPSPSPGDIVHFPPKP